jgi:hypothetical protein
MADVDSYKNVELLREYSLSEALSGMSMVGGIIKMLVNEIHAEEERSERIQLQERLNQQKDAQINALIEQNQQLIAALMGQQQQTRPAGQNIDLAALLEALMAQATPQQRQQVQRLLANNPQAAARLQLPAQAGVRRGSR